MENSFSLYIFIDKYLKFKEIVCLIDDVKFEMRPVLFYVNSHPYFQQWNSNWAIAFLNSTVDWSWEFWMSVLGCTSNFFVIQKKIENRDF